MDSEGEGGSAGGIRGFLCAIVEDQHQFILNHRVMWEESDVDVCVPIMEENQGDVP